MADWEFNGSVNFAPKKLQEEKFQEAKQLSEQIIDESSAEEFLQALDYLKYLNDDYDERLIDEEEYALSMLKSNEAIFKWITYPSNSQMHKQMFKELKDMEKDVAFNGGDVYEFVKKIDEFDAKIDEWNKDNEKYKIMCFAKYWFSYAPVIHEVKAIKYTEMYNGDE